MQKWEYCILEYETRTKESKSSSKEVIKFAKAKVHYLKKDKTERLFRHIYPKGDEIRKAITFLGDKGWELVESKSDEFGRKTITKYHFKRPLAE
jgi:hypothetical protein